MPGLARSRALPRRRRVSPFAEVAEQGAQADLPRHQLQKDGRLSITELATRVHLSVSLCHRRVRALEPSGAIRGDLALVDPAAVGLTFEALVFVTMPTSALAPYPAYNACVPPW
ncbi:Lrp/AsnC family transcriptional regulator [Pyxidicoccus sp. MSG2]|uniref:Lrp/AsnC family transcriptional regulator n=1 Tax=Pyxidicoccus sp. MSG2 TaxID=2996790 RepID=UPI00227020F6|nr:winged helix-turn-helix transcriptional regulator [Pyxidicoccus sp. MSG2]MCY1019137.1 winged helix-turn-helix transcriptional regulator [Pyxidicoccus sp. MSG2]